MAEEPSKSDEIVLPLYAEEVAVGKGCVATGRVRISLVTREDEKLVNELLTRQEVEIERRPIGKVVVEPPEISQAGDTVVIPVVEEIFTVMRRLVLKEEIRIRYVKRKETRQRRITLRRQEAVIDRLPAARTNSHNGASAGEPRSYEKPKNSQEKNR